MKNKNELEHLLSGVGILKSSGLLANVKLTDSINPSENSVNMNFNAGEAAKIRRTTPDSGKYADPVPADTPELMSASGSLMDSSISQKKTGVNHRIRISTENDAA